MSDDNIVQQMWITQDPTLANFYVVNGMAIALSDIEAETFCLIYGDFKRQLPYSYETESSASQLQPSDKYAVPDNNREFQARVSFAERALAATCGDPIKASQNMFIATDIPVCSVCRVRGDDSTIKLKLCSRCHRTRYCSTECQTVDWKYYHKILCTSTST